MKIEGSTSGKLFCRFFNFLSMSINLSSVLSILLIAMDRSRSINDPFTYRKKNSKRRASVFVICVWITSFLFPLPILLGFMEFDCKSCDIKVTVAESGFNPVFVYELTAFVVPFFVVVCLFYKIYRAAKNYRSTEERNGCSSNSEVVGNTKSPVSSERSGSNLRRHTYIRDDQNYAQIGRFLEKHRPAVNGLIAAMSLFVCYTPYFIVRFCQQFRTMAIEVNFWGYFPTFISTVINQYFYRNHSMWIYTRKLAAQLLRRKKPSMHFPTVIRSNIVNISDVYRRVYISGRITETEAASQPTQKKTSKLIRIILSQLKG